MRFTDYDRDIIDSMIDKLCAEDFLSVLEGHINYWDWKNDTSCTEPRFTRWEVFDDIGLEVHTGATKVCVMSDELGDWVLKFNLPFLRMDYCRQESFNYILAAERGLEHFFAETFWYGKIRDQDVYIQRRVEHTSWISDKIKKRFYDYVAETEEFYKEDFEDEDCYWDAISENAEDMCDMDRAAAVFGWNEELIDFIEERYINDLHEGNFGWSGDNYYIIDFSGY